MRVPGPNNANLDVKPGTWFLAIRLIEGQPTISGDSLTLGYKTYVKEKVVLSPAVDCLVIY